MLRVVTHPCALDTPNTESYQGYQGYYLEGFHTLGNPDNPNNPDRIPSNNLSLTHTLSLSINVYMYI